MEISVDDRLAILDLIARYNRTIDTNDGECWAGTFTADGVFNGPAGQAQGRAQLIALCHELAEQFPGGFHMTDNHLFELAGDVVRHTCHLSFQIPGEDGTQIWLLGYDDEIVNEGGDWKFRVRNVGPLSTPAP